MNVEIQHDNSMLLVMLYIHVCGLCGMPGHNRRGHDMFMRRKNLRDGGTSAVLSRTMSSPARVQSPVRVDVGRLGHHANGDENGNPTRQTARRQTGRRAPSRSRSTPNKRRRTAREVADDVEIEGLPTAVVADVPVVATEATSRPMYTCLAAVPAGINANQRNTFVSNTASYLATHKTVAERDAMHKHVGATMHDDYADDLYEYHMADTHMSQEQDYQSIESPAAAPDLNAAKCSLATLLVNLVRTRGSLSSRKDLTGSSTPSVAGYHFADEWKYIESQETYLAADGEDAAGDTVVTPIELDTHGTIMDRSRELNDFSVTVTVSNTHVPEQWFVAYALFLDQVRLAPITVPDCV